MENDEEYNMVKKEHTVNLNLLNKSERVMAEISYNSKIIQAVDCFSYSALIPLSRMPTGMQEEYNTSVVKLEKYIQRYEEM